MKKTIILFASVLLAIQMQAQVKVGSNGNMMVGSTTGTPKSTLSVGGIGDSISILNISNSLGNADSRNCVKIYSSGYRSVNGTVVDLYNDIRRYGSNIGLNIQPSINFSYGPAFGVRSLAGNSEYATFAVFGGVVNGCSDGTISNPKSAGIYGSSTTNMSFVYPGVYAGYFNGDIRVAGGNIYGTLSTPATSPSGSGSVVAVPADASTEERVSSKLSGVQLLQTIIPAETARSSSTGQRSELPTFDCDSTMSPEEKMAVTDRAIEAYSKLTVTNCEAPSVRYSLNPDQLKQVFPELVYEDKYGNVSINYVEMVPLLLQYINELSAEVKAQRAVLAEYTGDKTMMTEANKRNEATALADAETDILSLDQNNPNPFSETTSIGVTVPESVKTANIFIYDMSGKEIKRMAIAARGKTSVSIAGEGLTSGMYLYSLIADGKVVSTKRMVLAK